ncbi:MAG: CBM35 domain-containing protein, partial [Verrucomicrobiota bacterium]
PETVDLTVNPKILANNAEILHTSTRLFRRWLQAVTSGHEIELSVCKVDQTINIDYSMGHHGIAVQPSFDELERMKKSVPRNLVLDTDFWWLVYPSSVPGDGSVTEQVFISGCMITAGKTAHFVCDDEWLIRKPAHLGKGDYTEVERRSYLPHWLQHEFMHYVYHQFSEFGLEDVSHKWHSPQQYPWPRSFNTGRGHLEPDYYAESIDKLLLNAKPGMYERFNHPTYVDVHQVSIEQIPGRYAHPENRDNPWHRGKLEQLGDRLQWSNDAGVTMSFEEGTEVLKLAKGAPYPGQKFVFELDEANRVVGLRMGMTHLVKEPDRPGEIYRHPLGPLTRLQVEGGTLNGPKIENAHPGYDADGFVAVNGMNASVTLQANAPADGEYSMQIRYAAPDSGRKLTVLINGSSSYQVHFSRTASWSAWSDATLKVGLRAGPNRIRIQQRAGDLGPVNLDYIDFEGSESPAHSLGGNVFDTQPENDRGNGTSGTKAPGPTGGDRLRAWWVVTGSVNGKSYSSDIFGSQEEASRDLAQKTMKLEGQTPRRSYASQVKARTRTEARKKLGQK